MNARLPFTPVDFTAEAMTPFFEKKDAVWKLVADVGCHITDIPGDDFFEPDMKYGFLDRGSDTLCVAHIDTVFDPTLPLVENGRIFSSAVDNRLGIYIALSLLHKKGISCDVLITDFEEQLLSSARYFAPPPGREYNFAFSFDRKGSDVVLYQYHEDGGLLNTSLERSGFLLGHGTYSDICELGHLGCGCFNVGVGYCDDPHRLDAYADLDDTISQLNLFSRFWERNHWRHFAYDCRGVYAADRMKL